VIGNALLVGTGGFLGSVARWWISGMTQDRLGPGFPWGTLAVNVLGCFAIGALSQLAESRAVVFPPEARLLLVVGFLGGFTTFSAFGNDTLNLFRAGEPLLGWGNIALQLALTLGAVWAGRAGMQLLGH
jgi:fluoride exporter